MSVPRITPATVFVERWRSEGEPGLDKLAGRMRFNNNDKMYVAGLASFIKNYNKAVST